MEDKYKKTLHEFYVAYEKLKEYGTYRLHTHSSVYPKDDALIEIFAYSGERKGERILKVTNEDEIEAYAQATDQLYSTLQLLRGKERRQAV